MIIREANLQDYKELKRLWCKTFGDEPEDVDYLFDMLKATGYVAIDEESGAVASALTLYQAGKWNDASCSKVSHSDVSHSDCPVYITYALCTEESYQSLGFGSRLTEYVSQLVYNRGALSMLCPAEESLQKFYGRLGYKCACYCQDVTITPEDMADGIFTEDDFECEEEMNFPEMEVSVRIIGSSEYNKLREDFLGDIPHVSLSSDFLRYIESISYNGSGMLLLNNGDAICVLEGTIPDPKAGENFLQVSELLINPKLLSMSSEIHEKFAIGLAKLFETDGITYRTVGTDRVQAMLWADTNTENRETSGISASHESRSENALDKIQAYFGFPID